MIFTMGKRKKKTGRKKSEKVIELSKVVPPTQTLPDTSEEESANYGGLPMRDLKKNLGCG